jgi:hypothetical protein
MRRATAACQRASPRESGDISPAIRDNGFAKAAQSRVQPL